MKFYVNGRLICKKLKDKKTKFRLVLAQLTYENLSEYIFHNSSYRDQLFMCQKRRIKPAIDRNPKN
ncbi:MAG TPA: hypothetical protein DCY95_15670 [Algoriphagus sp.]|nr:hypothetical protein [Algoriphagus sp.]